MKNFSKKEWAPIALSLLAVATFAQTSISGKVTEAATGDPLAGVNILVKGQVICTISDNKGDFTVNVNSAPPMTLVFSFVGYKTQEVEIKDANTTALSIAMDEQVQLGQEVVVSASRIEE